MKLDSKFLPMTYGFLGAASFWMLAHSGPAVAQLSGAVPAFLRLQATTPGTQQTGNANINGTAIAGQFQGGGAGLTNLNATNITTGTIASARLPVPLSLSGSVGVGPVIKGLNSSNSVLSSGLTGEVTGTTGTVYGVTGITASTNGRAVAGFANSTSGNSSAGYFTNKSATGFGLQVESDGTYGIRSESTLESGSAYGGYFVTNSTTGRGMVGQSNADSGGTYGVYGSAQSTSGAGVYGTAVASTGTTSGVYGLALSTTGKGVFGWASSSTGTTYGGRFESDSTSGRGAFGWATATSGTTWGVYGRSDSNAGAGVRGTATANTGLTIGGDFESQSTSGTGVNGVATSTSGATAGGTFESNSPSGAGVVGRGKATTGNSYGLFGITDSATGIAVYATATASDESVGVLANCGAGGTAIVANSNSNIANGFGIYAQSLSTDAGNAVRGYVPASNAIRAKGLYGIIESDQSNNYGVLGQGEGTTSWGVFALGNSGATGTKSFRIDYPLDPTNKYLLHYSTESPTPQNFYTGNVVTDAQGKAWVTLPEYFHEINVNFKYQLTVVDNNESNQFVQVKVGREIANGRFLVMSSAPNTKVSWRVDADRNDLFVRAQKPKDVVEKNPVEKGKYQNPELYGKPKSSSEFYEGSAVRKQARFNAQSAGASRP